MNKQNREKVNGIIENLTNLDNQLHELYLQESELFNNAILSKYTVPHERDLKTKIRGKNICDLNRATYKISDVISSLEEILYREVTE